VLEQALAQAGFDPHRDRVGADFAQPGQQAAPEDVDQQGLHERQHLGGGLPAEEDAVHDAAEEPGLADGQESGQKSREDRGG
jgi:hypothetical protein